MADVVMACHTESFAGSTICVFPHGPDFRTEVDGKDIGTYLKLESAVKAARDRVMWDLEEAGRRCKAENDSGHGLYLLPRRED